MYDGRDFFGEKIMNSYYRSAENRIPSSGIVQYRSLMLSFVLVKEDLI